MTTDCYEIKRRPDSQWEIRPIRDYECIAVDLSPSFCVIHSLSNIASGWMVRNDWPDEEPQISIERSGGSTIIYDIRMPEQKSFREQWEGECGDAKVWDK